MLPNPESLASNPECEDGDVMTVNELHQTVVEGFTEPRRENQEPRTAIDARLRGTDAWFDRIDARFREQEEEFRRQCDVVVEKVEALVRPVIEAHERLATVVGNHEVRLQAIEKHS
jgi:hypothetical protein